MGKIIAGLFSPVVVAARHEFDELFLRGELATHWREELSDQERELVRSAFELGYVKGYCDWDDDDGQEGET